MLAGELQQFGLCEEVGLTTEWTVAAQLDRHRAAVHQVFNVAALAGVTRDSTAVYAGLHAGTGVQVMYSGKPLSIIENES
jgi:hypothetical protein